MGQHLLPERGSSASAARSSFIASRIWSGMVTGSMTNTPATLGGLSR
jgi:hypothetical protein